MIGDFSFSDFIIFILCTVLHQYKPDNNLQASLVDLGTLYDPLVQYLPRRGINYSIVYMQIHPIIQNIRCTVNMSPALPLPPVSPSPHLGPANPETKQQKLKNNQHSTVIFFNYLSFFFFFLEFGCDEYKYLQSISSRGSEWPYFPLFSLQTERRSSFKVLSSVTVSILP